MKKIFMCCLISLFAIAAMAEKQIVTLYVPDMVCENCQGKIDKVLAFEKGVRSLDYNLEKRQVAITFDDKKTDVKTLQGALLKHISYKSYKVDAEGNIQVSEEDVINKE